MIETKSHQTWRNKHSGRQTEKETHVQQRGRGWEGRMEGNKEKGKEGDKMKMTWAGGEGKKREGNGKIHRQRRWR